MTMIPSHLSRALALTAGGACCALVLCNAPRTAHAAEAKVEFPAPSSHGVIKQRVGVTDVEIDYSRPNKNGREIFGKLVPYGAVWRTGANSATSISFSGPVKLGGTEIPAGKYGLYTIPADGDWKVIISKKSNEWGAYTYKEENDIARITAKTGKLPFDLETFTIGFDRVKENSAELYLGWDNTIVMLPLTVDTVTQVKADIARVAGSPDATPQFYGVASRWAETETGLRRRCSGRSTRRCSRSRSRRPW